MKPRLLLFMVFAIACQLQAQIPTTGMIAHYPFNGNANDAGPNGIHGTVNGPTLTTDRFQNPNEAYHFAGSTQCITLADSAFDFAHSNFTISVWAKWTADPRNTTHIFDKQGYPLNGGNGYRSYTGATGELWVTLSSSPFSEYNSHFIPTVNTWYHLVVTMVNAGQISLYVNGSLMLSGAVTSINGNSSVLTLGKRVDYDGSSFVGDMDDVRIYNQSLAQEEVNMLFGETHSTDSLELISFSPSRNANPIASTSNIAITFNSPVDPASITNAAIRIHGSVSGSHEFTPGFSLDLREIVLDPITDFQKGEMVTITATNEIGSAKGGRLSQPYAWSFSISPTKAGSSFVSKQVPTEGMNSAFVTASDIDKNGSPDIITANYFSNTITILSNEVGGAFISTILAGQSGPHGVATGDFNGDGNTDIATSFWGTSKVGIYFNNGNLQFSYPQYYYIGGSPHSVAAGDFDNDGILDILWSDYNGRIGILKNIGNGNFVQGPTMNLSLGVTNPMICDVNNDGQQDLIIPSALNQIYVIKNTGHGTYATPEAYQIEGSHYQCAVGDLDGDGFIDLAVPNGNGQASILINDGTGSFITNPIFAAKSRAAVILDFNYDGLPDLAFSHWWNAQVEFFANKGLAGFVSVGNAFAAPNVWEMSAADFDNDGSIDVVATHEFDSNVTIIRNINAVPPSNTTPTACAGSNQEFACAVESVLVTMNASQSFDPDGDLLHYRWELNGSILSSAKIDSVRFAEGTHIVLLTISDGQSIAQDSIIVTIENDTKPPALTIPPDIVVSANTRDGYRGSIGLATAIDSCGKLPLVVNNAPEVFPLGETEVTFSAIDFAGNVATGIQKVTVTRFPVCVDIKPGSFPNSVNQKAKGVLPVAVLTTATFDARTIDVSSVRFGQAEASELHSKGHPEDVDRDGDIDLMLHFDIQSVGMNAGDTIICLKGKAFSGMPIGGYDYVHSVLRKEETSGEQPPPFALRLLENYPNPFNPSTQISYELPSPYHVSIKVFDQVGRVVATLVNKQQSMGPHSVIFDGGSLPSGQYFYRLTAGNFVETRKMLLLK